MKLITFLLVSFLAHMVSTGNVIIGNGNNVRGTDNVINHGDRNDVDGNGNTVTEGYNNEIWGNLNQLFRQRNIYIQGNGLKYIPAEISPAANPNLSSDSHSSGCRD